MGLVTDKCLPLIAGLVEKHINEIDSQIDEVLARRDQLDREITALNGLRADYCGELQGIHWQQERRVLDLKNLRNIAETQGKLNAVKEYKECTGTTLMDAKRIVEAIAKELRWEFNGYSGSHF